MSFYEKYENTEREFLKFLKKYVKDNGFPPSLAEIGTHLDLSVPSVKYWRDKLALQGKLSYVPNQVRSMRVLEK